jgi:transcription initiation factor TFIIIB Brf1 subunit/transcription initiation factor TFIIB
MVDLDAVWAQLDSLKISEDPVPQTREHICVCGGLKVLITLPTCTDCGRVDSEFISDEAEWRGGMDDDGHVSDPSRCGAPADERFSEMWSMGTIMSVRSNASYAMKKLARIDFHTSMNHKDRSLFHNYAHMEKACKDLPRHVVKEAEEMYRKFSLEKLTRGAVRTGIKANCVLEACKRNKLSRSIAEIAAAFEIPTKDISRTAEIFRSVFKTENRSTMASDIAARMLSACPELAEETRRRLRMRVIRICEQVQESNELMGKTPKSIAAGVIRVVTQLDVNVVCSMCDVSVPTIKKMEIILTTLIH